MAKLTAHRAKPGDAKPGFPSSTVEYANIGLMVLSLVMAAVVPFELFLISYAILGPLHYLTEISWLHDRKYFTKGNNNQIVLLIIGGLIVLKAITNHYGWRIPYFSDFDSKLIFVALTVSLLMVFTQNIFIKIAGLFIILFAA